MRHGSLTRFAVVVLGALTIGACSAESGDPLTGTGGTGSGSGGTTGAAGTGSTGTAGTGSTGTAGTTGAAGTTGTAGTTGGAGSTGSAGTGAAGTGTAGTGAAGTTGGGVVKSAGCMKEVTDSSTAWTVHDITVAGVAAKYTANFGMRRYWTRPPKNYDPDKAYPLIIWGQGCGQGNTPENTPISMNPASADNAVQVELLASQKQQNHCYSAGPDGDAPDSPELAYFDQILSEVSNSFCVDKSKVFVGGYSSGAWFSGLMGCNRTNVVRGIGLAAGGLQLNHDACTGPVAALITRGTTDNGTPLAQTEALRDNIRMRNGCATTTKAWTPTWNAGEGPANVSSCVSYDGCMAGYPLIWCPTPGGHTNTLGDTKLTQFALWKLWSTLP